MVYGEVMCRYGNSVAGERTEMVMKSRLLIGVVGPVDVWPEASVNKKVDNESTVVVVKLR